MIECYALEKGIKNINQNKLKEILKKGIEMQKEPLRPKTAWILYLRWRVTYDNIK